MTWTLDLPAFRRSPLASTAMIDETDLPVNHDPVMVSEVLEALELKPGMTVVDGTLGLGGHTSHFLQAVSPGGVVVGLDWDEAMLARARKRLGNPESATLITRHEDFRNLAGVVNEERLTPDGILFDLGLNSAQVDDPERGLSFRAEGPLDMRMDRSRGEPASALVNRLSPHELENILFEFGDERWARAIAKVIVERRKSQPLRTTQDLVDCVLAAIPAGAREKRIHPATRTFQAIRIATTRELEGLREAILEAAETLAVGGTLAILSYHGGEDRIVKTAFRSLAESGFKELYKKPIAPSGAEIQRNRRSRSAKLRALRRTAAAAR
jgi:16S rRNA (cytosine1402-N4)-methyltransferase